MEQASAPPTWQDVLSVAWLLFWRAGLLFAAAWSGISRLFLTDASDLTRIAVAAAIAFAALYVGANMALVKEYRGLRLKVLRTLA